MNKKVCVSYSLGKDSTLALYRTIKSGKDVVALIISVDEKNLRSWFHGVDTLLIDAVSKSLNIPVILAKGDGNNYREVFIEAIESAKQLGAMECIFGDIDIEDHYKWCNSVCIDAGVESCFPLWQESRRDIVEEFIDNGFKAIIKTVSKQYDLNEKFLNQVLTHELVNEFEKLGIDVCGENGEYHTFVCDGPIFSEPIDVKSAGTFESDYSFSTILELSNE
ncbi:MAG: diphthine--ammonia ligase [Bacilli bacterium]